MALIIILHAAFPYPFPVLYYTWYDHELLKHIVPDAINAIDSFRLD